MRTYSTKRTDQWVQVDDALIGDATGDWFGHAVSLANYSTIAVGAPFHDSGGTSAGLVRVLQTAQGIRDDRGGGGGGNDGQSVRGDADITGYTTRLPWESRTAAVWRIPQAAIALVVAWML